MDDIRDVEIQKLDLILERLLDSATLTCDAIDFLIDTTIKLKEKMVVEANRESRKATLEHIAAAFARAANDVHLETEGIENGDNICFEEQRKGWSGELASAGEVIRDTLIQQVIPAPSLIRNTVSRERRVFDTPESPRAIFPMFSGHQVRQALCSDQHTIPQKSLISEPRECDFREHTLLRESGVCTCQRPSRSMESTRLRHNSKHSLDHPRKSSEISSQGARSSEGRVRNGNQRFSGTVDVPESVLRVLNIIGTPRIHHGVTYRETYGIQKGHERPSAQENKEAGDRKANGAKITEMPSASMPYREDNFCMSLSSILEPPIPTTNEVKMVPGVGYGLRIFSACQSRVKDLGENRGYLHFSTGQNVSKDLKEHCTPDPVGVNRQQVDGGHKAVVTNQDAPETVTLARGHSRGDFARPSIIVNIAGKVVGLKVSIDLPEAPEGSNPIILQHGGAEMEVDFKDVTASPVDYNQLNLPVITSFQSRNIMEQKKEKGTRTVNEAQLPGRGKPAGYITVVEFPTTASTMTSCLKIPNLRKEDMGAKIGQRGTIGRNQAVEGYPQDEKLPRFNYNGPSGVLEEHNLVCNFDTGLRNKAGNSSQAQWSEWLKEAKTEIKEESFWVRDFADPVLPDEPCKQEPLSPESENAREYTPEPFDALAELEMLETSGPIRNLCKVPSISEPTQEAKWVSTHKQKGTGDPPTSVMKKCRRVEETPEKKSMWPRLQKMVDKYRAGVTMDTSEKEKKRKLTKIHDSPPTKRRTIEDFPAGSADRINTVTQCDDKLRRKGDQIIAEMFRNRQQKKTRGKKADPGPLTTKSSLNESAKKAPIPACEPQEEWDAKGHATHLESTEADACEPEANHYNVDQDRTEGQVKKHQIWAVFDKVDGMPRSWVRVENVAHSPEFKAWVSWLQPHKLSPQALHWLKSTGVNLSCGDFKKGKSGILKGVKCFSHEMIAERRPDDVIRIYPRKGEVWALFSPNTGLRKTRASNCSILHSRYRLVEILTSAGGEISPEVQELGLLAGFRTIWQPIYAKPDVLPENNMELFSHRVPASRMRIDGGLKIPEGCWDVDPSGVPVEDSLASSSKMIRRSSRS